MDLRWTPSWDHGRGWVAARGQFGAAGLMISPWTDGAPSDGVRASYVGLEGGVLRYLPRGFYAGGQMVGVLRGFRPRQAPPKARFSRDFRGF